MQFVRLLDLGLIMRWAAFPGFGEAFLPGEIKWDLDAEPFLQQMGDIEGGALKHYPTSPLARMDYAKRFSDQLYLSNAVNYCGALRSPVCSRALALGYDLYFVHVENKFVCVLPCLLFGEHSVVFTVVCVAFCNQGDIT